MRRSLISFAAIAGLTAAFTAGPAKADPYKWCANLSRGATNCGYVTLEQCMATVRGMGGSCRINGFYTGPAESPGRHKRVHG